MTVMLLEWGRHHVAPALFALSLTASFAMHSFWSPWLLVSWAALAGGVVLSRRSIGPKWVLAGLLVLLGLVFAAVPGSLLWGSGNWILSLGVAVWMAPALLFYLYSPANVIAWVVPAWLLHAGWVIYQAFANLTVLRPLAPTVMSLNPNLAAGFLVLGIVYFLTTPRLRWLVFPLMFALPLTGSRWAGIVCVSIILGMAVARKVALGPLVVAGLLLVGAMFVVWTAIPAWSHSVAGFEHLGSLIVPLSNGQVSERLAVPHIPSFLPRGVAEHPGLHNVPLRIAVENGILAAILWVGITGAALLGPWWRRRVNQGEFEGDSRTNGQTPSQNGATPATRISQRFGSSWWMLLALALLSVLDYYTWMGHLGGFWWLLVGIRLNHGRVSHVEDNFTGMGSAIDHLSGNGRAGGVANGGLRCACRHDPRGPCDVCLRSEDDALVGGPRG